MLSGPSGVPAAPERRETSPTRAATGGIRLSSSRWLPASRDERSGGGRLALGLLALVVLLVGGTCSSGTVSSGFVDDDFNTCVLDTRHWDFVDPLGDASASVLGAGSGDAVVEIHVPAGTSHNPWVSNDSARLLQPVNDTDLTLEARFDSVVAQRFQIQGLLVEENPGRFVRFDMHHDGSGPRLFVATITDGGAQIVHDLPIAASSGVHLRLTRTGDQWTPRYSLDGVEWIALAAFTHPMVASAAGVFAGNFASSGPAPAHTARIDYAYEGGSPSTEEDIGVVPSEVALDLSVSGPGTVELSPAGAVHACGTEVQLTAVADPGSELLGWSGAVGGSANPASVLMIEDASVTAFFGPDTTPPVVSDVEIAPGPEGARLRWSTQEPSDGLVRFGTTTAYELGEVASEAVLATRHEALLTGLAPESPFHLQIQAVDEAGNLGSSEDLAGQTTPANGSDPSGLFSDDFNGCVVDTGTWSVVDPLGDALFQIVGAGSGDAVLHMSVPAGVEHAPDKTNLAPRLIQPAQDTDLAVEVRFQSDVTERYQEQGLVVEGTNGEYLRFDFFSDGIGRFLFAAAYTPTSATVLGTSAVASGGDSLSMRIERVGDVWAQSWSVDGESWTTALQFARNMTVTGAGPFVGNEGSGGVVPAHTAVVDWFSVVATPAIPDDAEPIPDGTLLELAVEGSGSVAVDPDQASYACGESVTLSAAPDVGYAFDGWGGDLSGTKNPRSLVMSSDRFVSARFIVDVEPPVISDVEIFRTSTGAIVRWQTNEPATSLVRFGLGTLDQETPLDPTLTTDHMVTIEGLDPELDYEFQVESQDAAGFVSTSASVTGPAPQGPVITLFRGASQRSGFAGIPQPMWNLLGNVSDEDGVASLSVSVNGGAPQPLAMGPDTFRLDEPGDFNAEIPYGSLVEGQNELVVRAVDVLGNESATVVHLEFTGSVLPVPDLSIDWGSAPSLEDVATPVDGDWRIEGSSVRAVEMGYDRLLAIGDLSWTDYEARVTLTFHGFEGVFSSPSNGPALGLILRWPGHTPDGFQPARQWFPLGGFAAQRWQLSATGAVSQSTRMWGDAGLVLDASSGFNLAEGQDYTMRMQAQGLNGGGTVYRFKLWNAANPEPSAWTLEGIDTADVSVGSVLLVAHHVDVSWHSLVVSPLP